MKAQIIEVLTELRKELDRIVKTLDAHKSGFEFIGFSSFMVKQAFMWAGKTKGIMGSPNAYPASVDASSKTIESPVDTFDGEIVPDPSEDDIAFVKRMRLEISKCEDTVHRGLLPLLNDHKMFQLCAGNIWTAICNAKMYMGLELNKIRESENKKGVTYSATSRPDLIPVEKPVEVPSGEVTPNEVVPEKLDTSNAVSETGVDTHLPEPSPAQNEVTSEKPDTTSSEEKQN